MKSCYGEIVRGLLSALQVSAPREHRTFMDTERRLLRHFVATLAYRAQKALRGAP
jgi:hypothetical protein